MPCSASYLLSAPSSASDRGSSEVFSPSCSGELRARGPAHTGHSSPVSAGEIQSAGNPQFRSKYKMNQC